MKALNQTNKQFTNTKTPVLSDLPQKYCGKRNIRSVQANIPFSKIL